MWCEGGHCDSRPAPVDRSVPGSCARRGYVRRLPGVQLVRDGVVVRNVSLESFRETGGYAVPGLRPRHLNNNRRRAALQFNFWRPLTVESMRLVQTRVGLLAAPGREPHSWKIHITFLSSVVKTRRRLTVISLTGSRTGWLWLSNFLMF